MTLKELRKQKKLTQAKCAEYLGIPLRTYQNYEKDEAKASSMKYAFMMQKLQEYGYIDETHGLLTVEQIKEICAGIFKDYTVDYCYLFGSYAKGKATDTSDIDLLISTPITIGMEDASSVTATVIHIMALLAMAQEEKTCLLGQLHRLLSRANC